MRAHTITTTRLALLLSLLALGELGLVACGGGDDDEDTPAEATVSPETTAEARFTTDTKTEARLSGKQVRELKRVANHWAALFAVHSCNRYMGQPVCQRLLCHHPVVILENCTPVSRAFRKSFADARIEDIKFKGVIHIPPLNDPSYLATVEFSNGQVVAFAGEALGREQCYGAGPGVRCAWNFADWQHNRRFLRAATTPHSLRRRAAGVDRGPGFFGDAVPAHCASAPAKNGVL
jgi:hypothetical protein